MSESKYLTRARIWADANAAGWVVELLHDTRPQLPLNKVRNGVHNPRTCDAYADSLAQRLGWVS
jgi:hypothetical protein